MTVAFQYVASMAELYLARRLLQSVVPQSFPGASRAHRQRKWAGRLSCRATPVRLTNHHPTQPADTFLNAGRKFRTTNQADFAVRFYLLPHRGNAGRKQHLRIETKIPHMRRIK